jgi:hypothetical protein
MVAFNITRLHNLPVYFFFTKPTRKEAPASDFKNFSQEELVKEVHSLSQKLRVVSEENAQLKLELEKEKAAKNGATEVVCAISIIGKAQRGQLRGNLFVV